MDIAPHTPDVGPVDVLPLVRLAGVTKRFGQVLANDDISLSIMPGRIKALLGENGAGKSTLMAMLAGRFEPDAGHIEVAGKPVAFASSRQAIAAGIGMVYQHFMLVEDMSVAENVLLGQAGGFFLDPAQMRATVGELAARFGLGIDPAARVGDLSMGERQRVEILKLLHRKSRVLIFDEPTAVLTPGETAALFDALRSMSAQGKAIVFISHKLEEVLSVADEIAVLRRGRIEGEFLAADVTSPADLARRMVGRDVLLDVHRDPVPPGPLVLAVRDLSLQGANLSGPALLDHVSFDLRQGEVLAVVGVAGNGQQQLVETVCGLSRPESGQVELLGHGWDEFHKYHDWDGALAWVPEDRAGLATCRSLDLTDNMLLTTREGFSRGMWLDRARARTAAREIVREHNVQPGRIGLQAWQLSGGNLQKFVLGRELRRRPRLLVAEQPTQGLDISATEAVWQRLLEARKSMGVLLVTGDLAEALQLADRILVLYRGRVMGLFPASDSGQVERIGALMAGLS
ncbi:MAG: branched-chain amino acid ABC transporter ATP-binding protein [Desulfovibrionales bacterium GWA2_65_9]|nr:MAG: branched-chain amino acid ABC transporter ATP-binding protein [Desulfovibrionales bacterium GWA2_65_9]